MALDPAAQLLRTSPRSLPVAPALADTCRRSAAPRTWTSSSEMRPWPPLLAPVRYNKTAIR